MLYLLQALSTWSIAALSIGLFFGFLSWKAATEGERPVSSRSGALLFLFPVIVGAVVAWMRWLPGRYGLWLETGLLLVVFYFIGCALGCLLRRLLSGGSAARKAAPAAAAEEIEPSTAGAEASPAAEAVAPELTSAVDDLTRQAEALAAATPAALAASEAAQEILADRAGTEPSSSPEPPTSSPQAEAPLPEPAADGDNLRLIQGVNEQIARELRKLGVRRFGQIAAWTPEQQQGIGEKIRQCGPLARLYWVAQARLLAGGVETEFSRAVRRGAAHREIMEEPLDEAAAGILLPALPQVITPHGNDEIYAGLRPLSLLQPPYGEKDELTRISGIDPWIEEQLKALGVWTYAQIAHWSEENARWIGSYLAFPGRVEAENWVVQARELAEARNACADDSTSA